MYVGRGIRVSIDREKGASRKMVPMVEIRSSYAFCRTPLKDTRKWQKTFLEAIESEQQFDRWGA